tara:strand:- start:330 stop:902 length:573 start_codon:yes stop_codon:yes gene_type:complete
MLSYLALFASGNGSNVENIAKYFKDSSKIKIQLLISNKHNAYVLERAKKLNIPSKVFTNKSINDGDLYKYLISTPVTHIILAGYINLIPQNIINRYKNKIINIHPALLPNFGGKGFYGNHVHESVLESGYNKSGITIHLVNEEYDKGQILFQKSIAVYPQDTVETLSFKIHELEHIFFPEIIEKYILNKL